MRRVIDEDTQQGLNLKQLDAVIERRIYGYYSQPFKGRPKYKQLFREYYEMLPESMHAFLDLRIGVKLGEIHHRRSFMKMKKANQMVKALTNIKSLNVQIPTQIQN